MSNQESQKIFEQIYNDTYSALLKYVILNCQNIDDVNDILQETYTQLFRIMQKQEIIDARPFIFGIAKNKLKRHHSYTSKLKKNFVNKNINDDEFIDSISSNYNLEDQLLNKLTEEEIWSYLEKKKPLITKIFYLYYTEDITIKEIAKDLDINESMVKNYLYRTLKELNLIFRKEEDEDVR